MLAFGIDTSNYATSLAVVNTATKEVVCAKKRLLPVPEGALGLRQSDALFHHTVALPQLLAEMQQEGAFSRPVLAVGVSQTPRPVKGSYMPCFLAGSSFATAYAAALGAPLVKTSHQQGHLASALFGAQNKELDNMQLLFFHLSGGTTELLLTQQNEILRPLSGSLDLYAGQAVDRLGVKLGFSFPAGAQLSALAATCDETVHPKISVQGMQCHFSGLQNQCEALLAQGKTPAYVAKYCLSAIAETLLAMLHAARKAVGHLPAVFAGGVMSSALVRNIVENRAEDVFFVPPHLSADNAVGVALIAAKGE